MHLRSLAICAALAACHGGGDTAPQTPEGLAAQAEAAYNGGSGAPDLAKSFPLAKQACDADSAFGCTLLGLHYQDARGAPWDHAAAIAAYEKGCRLGDGTSCFNLESMYSGGHGVVVDRKKADELHTKARTEWEAQCAGHEVRRCVNVAYLLGTDAPPVAEVRARILELDQKACAAGDAVGCAIVPRALLDLGKLAPADYIARTAAECDKGTADACAELGSTLRAGDPEHGVPKAETRGMAVLHQACALGSPAGCYYADEFEAACDRGYASGCSAIAEAELEKDPPRSAAFAKRGCQGGDGGACELLAQAYRFGRGVEHDDETAITWAREACSMGRPTMCAVLMAKGLDVPVPPEAQPALYRSACESGVAAACTHISP